MKTIFIVCAAVLAVILFGLYVLPEDAPTGGNFGQTMTNSSVSVASSTATVVFAEYAQPSCRRLFNNSTSTVWCSVSNTASATVSSGIPLGPVGTTSTVNQPVSVVIGCEHSESRPERITCISGANPAPLSYFGY